MKKKKSERAIDVLTARTRKSLDLLWDSAHLRGRCWGRKSTFQHNPFSGTNITIGEGNEIVTINALSSPDGTPVLIIHEFTRSANTALGKKIRKLLEDADLI